MRKFLKNWKVQNFKELFLQKSEIILKIVNIYRHYTNLGTRNIKKVNDKKWVDLYENREMLF